MDNPKKPLIFFWVKTYKNPNKDIENLKESLEYIRRNINLKDYPILIKTNFDGNTPENTLDSEYFIETDTLFIERVKKYMEIKQITEEEYYLHKSLTIL